LTLLHKFLFRCTRDYLLYGWVTAMRYFFPGWKVEKIIDGFLTRFQVYAHDWTPQAARIAYYRMNREELSMSETSIKTHTACE
jgi:hypothetical protein